MLQRTSSRLRWLGIALSSILLSPTIGFVSPVVAAQRIYGTYGALESSISVNTLEKFALTGKIDGELTAYARNLSPQQLARLRRILLTPIDLSPVAVSQFLYTPIGETLLQRLGQIIQTEAGNPGFYAIRASLILAAADKQEGFTLLNVLRRFPTNGIRINLGRSLNIVEELQGLVTRTNQAIALIDQQSVAAATQPQFDFSRLPNLEARGTFNWNKRTLILYDRQRDRRFPADIYLPTTTTPVPVIVISHGLGSDRSTFEYLAQQLASYGFAVAVPEHPYSNAEQLRSLLAGRSNVLSQPNEFINRPLDVKFLLDVLARLDQSDSDFQLNMQQVGVIGHSFGGYTALALAGADLNFDQLQQDCQKLNDTLNVSLFLQCRALQLPRTEYNLRDPRVKAAIAINPIASSVFGQTELSKIKIPVMIVSSSNDRVAPALTEQILPFSWLTSKEKYLVVLEGGTHFSASGESKPGTDPLPLPASVIGPEPALARGYLQALSVAFLETHVANSQQYRPYLSAEYAKAISQSPLTLSLVQSLPAELLDRNVAQKTDQNNSQFAHSQFAIEEGASP